MRAFASAAAVVLLSSFFGLFGSTPADAQTATYQYVGTGDSILAIVANQPAPSGIILTDTAWIDMEYGRAPYEPGMAGRASTASIWPLMVERSKPGGWVIVQDNAIGVAPATWAGLLHEMVDELPDDRCLAVVPPAFHPDFDERRHVEAVDLARVTVMEVAQQPCHAVIEWPEAVMADRSLVCDPDAVPQFGAQMPRDIDNRVPSRCDGQHPSRGGQEWLAAAIERATGLALR